MLLSSFRLLSKLPLSVLQAIGSMLGQLAYLLSPSYRRRLQENIGHAGYSMHLAESVRESGKNILELAFIWFASQERIRAKVTIENWDLVQKTADNTQGVIFLTPHLGCFEIIAQVIAMNLPITVMYRPPRQAALEPLMGGARARHQLSLAPANLAGVRLLAKALKKRQAVGLLPDQVPQQGEGVWADFYGKPAYTMTLPAKLQQMSGASIILTYAERLPRGRGYRVHFLPFEEPMGETPQQQARAINAAMEKLIARCPAQYFWSYNRYKIPAGATAPGQEQA